MIMMEASAMATTTGGGPSHSALDAALDIFRVRQYFNVVVRARDVTTAIARTRCSSIRSGAGCCPCHLTAALYECRSSGRCVAPSLRRSRAASVWWPLVAAAPSHRWSAWPRHLRTAAPRCRSIRCAQARRCSDSRSAPGCRPTRSQSSRPRCGRATTSTLGGARSPRSSRRWRAAGAASCAATSSRRSIAANSAI